MNRRSLTRRLSFPAITGPGNFRPQLSISKTFPFGERFRGTLRYDINDPLKVYFFHQPNMRTIFKLEF